MDRGTNIAFKARLYMLLGKYPEYLIADPAERIDRALDAPIALGSLDLTLLAGATEIDRVCAHTVMVLRGEACKPLLDALGVMDPDRIVAMYYALPDYRRESVKNDVAWAFHVGNAPEGVGDVIDQARGWLEEQDRMAADRARLDATVPPAVSARLKRAERVMLYRQAGVAIDVTPEELVEIEASERIGTRVLANVGLVREEIEALGEDRHDPEAQEKAIRRAMSRMS